MSSRAGLASAVSRGVALFLSAFALANAAVVIAGRGRTEDIWWLDLGVIGDGAAVILGVVTMLVLAWYAVDPRPGARRRMVSVLCLCACAGVAIINWLGYGDAIAHGGVTGGVLPLSAVVAATYVWLAACVWSAGTRGGSGRDTRGEWWAVAGWAIAAALVFPLLQVAFFGTTDYRRPADVAVVLGAKAYRSGMLSQSLEDRVATAVGLYRQGLVDRLLMSGGVDSEGVDEASAMRDRAIELGVPADAIVVDREGLDSDSTVRNTMRMMSPDARVLVVSQFYHLPRLKLAYRAAGKDVQTVPAASGRPISKTPLFVAREIPGFWVYWARAAWRDLVAR